MSTTDTRPFGQESLPDNAEPHVGRSVRIRTFNTIAIIVSAVLALIALNTVEQIFKADSSFQSANEAFFACEEAADELQIASDYLTAQARMYVMTGNREHLDHYLEELLVTDRRGEAVETLKSRVRGQAASQSLNKALEYSNELAKREIHAMRLVAQATGLDDLPDTLADEELTDEEKKMSAQEQKEAGENAMFDSEYLSSKGHISTEVNNCTSSLISTLEFERTTSEKELHDLLTRLQIIVAALLAIVMIVIFITIFLILWPLSAYISRIKEGKRLQLRGAYELRYLADAYNAMYDENYRRTMHFKHAAEHDGLTGLYNRRAYDALLEENHENIALLLIDIDKFKEVNDTYGHDIGDAILKKVASSISSTFRLSDFPCRIGGDEFAVIMTHMNSSLKNIVIDRITTVTDALRDSSDGLPSTTLSIGIAFNDEAASVDDIYKAADSALYAAKERGRNGHVFFGDS